MIAMTGDLVMLPQVLTDVTKKGEVVTTVPADLEAVGEAV